MRRKHYSGTTYASVKNRNCCSACSSHAMYHLCPSAQLFNLVFLCAFLDSYSCHLPRGPVYPTFAATDTQRLCRARQWLQLRPQRGSPGCSWAQNTALTRLRHRNTARTRFAGAPRWPRRLSRRQRRFWRPFRWQQLAAETLTVCHAQCAQAGGSAWPRPRDKRAA